MYAIRRDARSGVGDAQPASVRWGGVARDRHGALRAVVLHRVRQEIQQHLLEALPVGQDVPLPHDGRRKADAAGGRLRPNEIERAMDDVARLDRLERDRAFPRFDSREVEDLVDESQQMPAPLEDVLDTVTLPRRFGVELEELSEAEDAVERRAQLVTHARQEFALGPVGGRGGLLGPLRALSLAALVVVRLDQPRVEHGVLEQQHDKHEAGRQQSIDPPGVEAEVESAGIEDHGQGDVEEPRAQHDHQPEVEDRVRAAPPEGGEGDQTQAPDERDDRVHRRGVAVVLHDRRQEVPRGGGKEGESAGDDERRRGTAEDREGRPPG